MIKRLFIVTLAIAKALDDVGHEAADRLRIAIQKTGTGVCEIE